MVLQVTVRVVRSILSKSSMNPPLDTSA